MKYRNPHVVNARSRHAGYHASERRAHEHVDFLNEVTPAPCARWLTNNVKIKPCNQCDCCAEYQSEY